MDSAGYRGYRCDSGVHRESPEVCALAAGRAQSYRSMPARLRSLRRRSEACCGQSMSAGSHVLEQSVHFKTVVVLHRLKMLLAFA